MKNIYKILAVGLVLAAFLIVIHTEFSPKNSLAGGTGYPHWGPAKNTSALCAQASSTLLIATSTGSRQFLRFSNLGTNAVYLGLGANAATTSGVTIFASSTFEFTQNPIIYMGSVYCLSGGPSATITIEELN